MQGSHVVLIVEDQFLLQLAAIELVESAGFIGIGASNADDAIKILQARQDIRIVITDVEMPGTMDGVKLAHFIRERWPPVHLIIVSGMALKNESQIPYGTKFFSKPYHDETLVAELQRLMQITA